MLRGARRPLLTVALVGLLLLAAASASAAPPRATQMAALTVAAIRQEALARLEERLARRERGLARRAARGARRARRPAQSRALIRSRRRHAKSALVHRRRARHHGERAAGLRPRAASLATPVRAVAAAAIPPPRRPPIPLGTAADWGELQSDSALRDLFLRGYGQMTAENEMKMFALQPLPGRYDFATADRMVNWALANGKRVRGHALVFGNQLPAWLTSRSWTRDELLGVMRDHISTVMAHFRGRVTEWDVVNEAVVDYGNGWTPNLWYQVIGPDYVDQAFRFARAADPGARLYYNDNGIDLPDHPHTAGVRALLAGLQSRGVPVDGVGMQNHMQNRYRVEGFQVAETMRRFEAMGLDVAVTEMDVRMDGGGSRDAELEAQRQAYSGAAWACRTEPRCTSFSTWGMSDRYSWITTPGLAPLVFDENLNAKPAWYAVEDWIKKP